MFVWVLSNILWLASVKIIDTSVVCRPGYKWLLFKIQVGNRAT